MSDNLKALADAGVSIWLDDLSRERLQSGNLAELVADSHVVGVTTNPSIFQAALRSGELYDAQAAELVGQGVDGIEDIVFALTTTDVRNACDVLRPVWEATDGVDGRVSIEVSPDLAHDTEATIAQARALWAEVDRENLLIKIPATPAGAPAIAAVLGEGISVNVTLIFGLEQYETVMEAYVAGLEKAQAAGHDLATIHSVASFFVSRVDTEIDARLAAAGADAALFGRAGVANARLAFEAYEKFFTGERWARLEDAGAHRQRPLWASTGVKNPEYDDTMYVIDLVTAGTVNTMPEPTMDAVRDHGTVRGDQVRGFYGDAADCLAALAEAGIDYDNVIDTLLDEGVEKFVTAWHELLATLEKSLADKGLGAGR